MSVHDHPGTLDLLAARGVGQHSAGQHDEGGAIVRRHLESCVACRVRAARLWHDLTPGDPDEDAVSRVLAASSPGPAIVATFSADRDAGPPRPGEIWRIGRDEALLVWVRRVFNDAVDVIPAVLDIELADSESLFLPAESTPLGMPLALLTGIRGHVGPRAMLQRIGYVHVAAAVTEVMAAARDGRVPQGVPVGPPIEADDDQRIEYRQVVADLLADLAPDTWTDDGPPDAAIAEITSLLIHELAFWDAGTRVLPMPLHEEPLRAGASGAESVTLEASLFPCARVTYLDTSLVVAVLAGASLDDALSLDAALSLNGAPLAAACLNLARMEPDAAAIVVTGDAIGWPAVVLRVADLQRAYETPSGRPAPPRVDSGQLPVIDALTKFLGRQLPAWEATEPVSARVSEIAISDLAGRSAADAVATIASAGRRSTIKAKKSAWTSLPAGLSTRIAGAIAAISSGEPAGDLLDGLIKDGADIRDDTDPGERAR